MSPDLSAALRVAALYGATFFAIGIHTPFFPVWLASTGLGPDRIALVMAVPMVVRVVVSPWTTGLADSRVAPWRLLLVSNLAVAAGYGAMTLEPAFAALLVLVAAIAVAQSPLTPLADAVAIGVMKARPRLHYGRVRLWGSAAFLAASLAGGVILDLTSAAAVPAMLAVAYALSAAVATAVPRTEAPAAPAGGTPRGRLPPVLPAVIAAAALVHASHALIYAFGSISFARAGYTPAEIGALWASGIAVEIALFAVAGGAVGARFPALLFLAVGAGTSLLRWLLMALDPGPWMLAALMASHGVSFGATHLGTIGLFATHAPAMARARSQGLLVSVVALTNAVVTVLSGPLYDGLGSRAYLAMAVLAAAGCACVWAARRLAQPQRAGEGGNTTLPS